MAIRLTEGTKEYVPVTVFDRSGQITNLDAQATSIKFDVQYDDDTYLYQDQAATASLMIVNCLIDISSGGPDGYLTAPIRLRLFVEFTVGGESPRLGPVVIQVKDEP